MDNSSRFFGYWRILMWGGAAALLSLPALAMRFYPDAGVNWSSGDFLVMGALLLVACAAVEVGARMSNNLLYRAGVIVAVGTGFLTVWVNLAVGMIGEGNNRANLLFLGVLGIAILGSFAVRFVARGMAQIMLAAGIAQAGIATYVAFAALDKPQTAVLIGLFALPWWLAAGLFQASAKRQ